MRHKWFIVCVLFVLAGTPAFSQHDDRDRGFYLDVGLGAGYISYADTLNEALKKYKDNGYGNITMAFDISVGWALLQNFILAGSLCVFSEKLIKDELDYLHVNTFLYGAGIRYYPLPSMKYLQFGLDFGFGKIGTASALTSAQNLYKKAGFAVKLSAAYDFDSSLSGPAILLGIEMIVENIKEDGYTLGGAAFIKFVFK